MYLFKIKVTGKTHDKYQSSCAHSSKVISKVKVFKKVNQTPRSRSQGYKNVGTYGKVLSQWLLIQCQNLQPFIGSVDVSKWVINSRVERKQTKKSLPIVRPSWCFPFHSLPFLSMALPFLSSYGLLDFSSSHFICSLNFSWKENDKKSKRLQSSSIIFFR